jgi:cyclohexadieny/prephenate dehydrogenase / 3-phosphoshikimate 1-carboxyvinyltransferase
MRLVVVGTGLMGGSFALASRQCGLFTDIKGIEPNPQRAQCALRLGLVDDLVDSVPADTDAVLLASPSHTIAAWAARLADHPAIVFDSASVKGAVLAELRAAGPLPPRFVPCHPLAGSEKSGPQAADGDLYRNHAVVLTPEAETDANAVEQVTNWWLRLGAQVRFMTGEQHDEVVARTSHLPHLLAFAFLRAVTDEDLAYGAGGFRDFTRIGAADADMWAPIFTLNRRAVLAALDGMEAELARARQLVECAGEAELKAFIAAAAERRRKFFHGG